MKLLIEIYKTIIHIVVDLRSTRERLVWSSLLIFILTLTYSQNAIICGLVSGWVTIIMTFYFVSKHNQGNHEQEKWIIDNTKTINPVRDPDA